MSKSVTIIPPREKQPVTLRVAAYCRVSSDSSDQLHSYAAQIRKYTEEIGGHDGWDLVDIYADMKIAYLIQRAETKYQENYRNKGFRYTECV